MRFVLIIIYVFFISITGLTAQGAISDNILYDEIKSLYGWDNLELFNNACRNPQQTATNSHSITANGYLLKDSLFITQPESALVTDDRGGTKRLDYFDDKWTKLTGTGFHSRLTKSELSIIDSSRDAEPASNSSPSKNYYEKLVFWIKDGYHAWIAKDRYGSTRLLLLSFGLVGLIGIRRKFKKN
jgi:hypothetical protein